MSRQVAAKQRVARIRSPAEHEAAHRLLADGGAPPLTVRMPGETVLFGLWDPAAPNGERLVAVGSHNALLTRAGFAATTDAEVQSAGMEVGWRYLAF